MKKIYVLFFLLLFCLVSLEAQQDSISVQTDTIENEITKRHKKRRFGFFKTHFHKNDSISYKNQIQGTAENVLNAVFPSDPTLNNADSIRREFDNSPSFGIYKNNYIALGTTLGGRVSRFNSDAKFQISFSQRITNSVLPFNTYLYLTYSQLAFWDIFRESFPFRDINFNPSIGIGRALAYKNRFLGVISMQFEHESNGKDEESSRSWNKISFMGLFKINRNWTFQAKAWIPLVDGENNRDIVEYKGWGFFAIDFNHKSKYNVGLIVTKRGTPNLNANITANFSYQLFKNTNQYLFVEYYNGYGEGLLDYKQYHHRIRAGIVIKPNFLFFY